MYSPASDYESVSSDYWSLYSSLRLLMTSVHSLPSVISPTSTHTNIIAMTFIHSGKYILFCRRELSRHYNKEDNSRIHAWWLILICKSPYVDFFEWITLETTKETCQCIISLKFNDCLDQDGKAIHQFYHHLVRNFLLFMADIYIWRQLGSKLLAL